MARSAFLTVSIALFASSRDGRELCNGPGSLPGVGLVQSPAAPFRVQETATQPASIVVPRKINRPARRFLAGFSPRRCRQHRFPRTNPLWGISPTPSPQLRALIDLQSFVLKTIAFRFIYEEKSDRIFRQRGIFRKTLKKWKSGTKQPKGKFLEQRSSSGEKDSAIIHTHAKKFPEKPNFILSFFILRSYQQKLLSA